MQGGRAAVAAHSFTAESGDLYGYEGGSNGPSHPGKADPGSASGDANERTHHSHPYLSDWACCCSHYTIRLPTINPTFLNMHD